MKFLCLGYYDAAMHQLPAERLEKLMQGCTPLLEALHASGSVIMDTRLDSRVVNVCSRNRKRIVTDGPFAETKELVGGLFLVEAPNLRAAVRIAARHPAARLGEEYGWRIEVRPVLEHKIMRRKRGSKAKAGK